VTGKLLLDTNIVIRLFRDEAAVKDQLALAGPVYVSCIAIGELLAGAQASLRVNENLDQVHSLVDDRLILPVDLGTAEFYGQIKAELRRKGTPIPENDIWIAAHALQYDLTLISSDRHFDHVERLLVTSW
jgi:tRNA(fMet)-specific endonuclease VapC